MKILHKKIEEIAEVIAGQSPPSTTYNKEGKGLPFFQGKADYGVKYPKVRFWCSEPTKISLPDDILISVRAPVGPVNINDQKSCIGRGLTAIRVNNDISRDYVYFFLKVNESRIAKLGVGSTFTSITQKDVKALVIPIPDNLEDQIRIANILSKAEALISQRKESLRLLDELLKSTFLEMFGDPFSNPKKLKIVSLEDVVVNEKNAIVDGPFGSSLNNGDYFETGVPIIRINNIRDEGFYDKEFKFINEQKYQELIRSKVNYNDILIARVGNTIGKSCIFNKEYKALLSTTGVAKATIDTNIANVKFINAQMRLPQYIKYVWNQTEGGGQPYLNLKKIKAFKLVLPDVKLQTQFAHIVEKTEALKAHYQTSLQELENLYGSLSQRAFKGELGFREGVLAMAAEPVNAYFRKKG